MGVLLAALEGRRLVLSVKNVDLNADSSTY